MGDYAICTEQLHKTYHSDGLRVHAIKGVDVRVKKGEFVAIMGHSGSGKTTLLELIGLLMTPSSGRIRIGGVDVSGMGESERADLRLEKIGFVFQYFNLLNELTALENVMLPGMMAGRAGSREKAAELLGMVGLGNRAGHKPNKLSGGEQQRVAIARALVNSPAILLADEPTGNLDSYNSLKIMELLRHLNKKEGQTIVMVTHERDLGEKADRIIWLRDGLVAKGA